MTLSDRIDELEHARVPFVRATVVRAQEPSSTKAGDRAIVPADEALHRAVGGHCAAGSVRTAALETLESGESLLLRVLPEEREAFPETPGARVVVNPCLSGGAMEIYLEPVLPAPVLHLVGASPTAEALATLAPAVDFVVTRADDGASPEGAVAVIVSTHGGDEVGAMRRALDAGVGFVGLVCSRTRAKEILHELAPAEDELPRVHPHVGLDIGARTAPEIALSILAAVIRAIRLEGLTAASLPSMSAPVPSTAIDPVCGMTVTVLPDTPHLQHDGVDYWFCNPGCRDTFASTLAS